MDQNLRALRDLATSALVVDLDFSSWGERIRLVLAEGRDSEWNSDSSVYNVDFLRPSKLVLDAPAGKGLPSSRWELWTARIQEHDDHAVIELEGLGPKVLVECRAVLVEWVPVPDLHIVDPRWYAPGRGLARPSLAETIERLRSRDRRR